jgi:DNA-binding MarR family transcriptional regulator
MSNLPEDTALDILETVPVVMRMLRAEMRRHRQLGLSLPQFRSLAFLRRQPGSSLNNLAEHLGLSAASTSKLVDGLVERGLVQRQEDLVDRRKIQLELTGEGFSAWEEAFLNTQAALSSRMKELSDEQRQLVRQAMAILRPMFEEQVGGEGDG